MSKVLDLTDAVTNIEETEPPLDPWANAPLLCLQQCNPSGEGSLLKMQYPAKENFQTFKIMEIVARYNFVRENFPLRMVKTSLGFPVLAREYVYTRTGYLAINITADGLCVWLSKKPPDLANNLTHKAQSWSVYVVTRQWWVSVINNANVLYCYVKKNVH